MATNTGEGEFGFQIAPMLDVLFVLLLFFMVSAGAQKHETTLAATLPGPVGPAGKVPVTLVIAADGQVNFNGAATDSSTDEKLPQTMTRLTAVLAEAPDRPVLIEPEPTARHQRVIDVLNLCKAVNVRNLAFSSASE